MKKKTVSVNDRMQRNYRYECSEPIGRNFDPEFRPELSPAEMLRLGVFGGKYMTDCKGEFPASWFDRAKLATNGKDPSLNYFGVDASQPLSEWRRKGWIHPDDPRGWFQWYCRYHLGRRSPEEDARRRDFTINGMFFDPPNDAVIDFVGGREDLAAGIVRAIGDPAQRFAEDRLRLLRAIRFATVLDFEIEPVTWEAIIQAAPGITAISAERIREELVRIFLSPQRVRGWDLLDASGNRVGVLRPHHVERAEHDEIDRALDQFDAACVSTRSHSGEHERTSLVRQVETRQ